MGEIKVIIYIVLPTLFYSDRGVVLRPFITRQVGPDKDIVVGTMGLNILAPCRSEKGDCCGLYSPEINEQTLVVQGIVLFLYWRRKLRLEFQGSMAAAKNQAAIF
jgi:hypothetical protein